MEEQEPIVYKTIPRSSSASSLASSSLKTPASAPLAVKLEAIPSGHSLPSHVSDHERTSKATTKGSGSNPSSRRNHKTMKQLEREVQRRSQLRSRPSYNLGRDTKQGTKGEKDDKHKDNNPPFKALTDLLFQTAVLGINTTAKVTKPTLSHVVLPLIRDLWELYMPLRIQTWMKVLPVTLSNLNNLLWDTDSGQVLQGKMNELRNDAVDMASSNAARQCWIDFTVLIIKFIEALHTPEVKALLDQYAVSFCRFVDVWSSGKAKRIWFDLSDALWALVEVGSDPLVVMTLAEGCAQICFALEEERVSLREWREKEDAAKRRRERDLRQMEMYPPDGEVVSGREGVEKALMHTLKDDGVKAKKDGVKSGPPSVILQNDSAKETPILDHVVSNDKDDESEITTDEIEDLKLQNEGEESHWIKLDSTGQHLVYEQGDGDSTPDVAASENDIHDDDQDIGDIFQESILQFHRRLNEVLDETRKGSKLSDAIEQKLLKESKLKEESSKEAECIRSVLDESANTTIVYSIKRFLDSNKWKILIVGSTCFFATIMLTWFALGCYGFYVIFLGGEKSPHVPSHLMHQHLSSTKADMTLQHRQPVIVQVMVGESKTSDDHKSGSSSNFASMSLDEWKKMSRDVETAIRKQIDSKDEL